MSWQMLDGPSRRPRLNWAVPEHLRDNSRYGPFRRLAVPAPLDPDALLQYMDNAISITENAQATRQLSLLFASASPVSPSQSSSSSSSSVLTSSSPSAAAPSSSASSSSSLSSSSQLLAGHLPDPGPSIPPLVPSARRISRFKSVPLQQTTYIIPALKEKDQEEATKLNPLVVFETKDMEPLYEQESSKRDASSSRLQVDKSESQQAEEKNGSEVDQTPGKGEEYDAQRADDAYRAACCALSAGDAELALSLLQVALEKCPPDKKNALGKVHRLMAAAMQLVEKNSAVLRALPMDKDAQ